MSESEVQLLNSPYGEATYELFRKLRRAFADKSGMIGVLDDIGTTRYPVMLRPRRFGKSTFVQMLKCFYDLSYKDRYEELFSGTDIYQKHLPSHNTYHVLDLDFSGVSGLDLGTLIESFIVAIRSGITNFRRRYRDFVFAPRPEEEKMPSSYIKSFINAYSDYSPAQSLYVMIDEYDNFASSLLHCNLELFKTVIGAGGFVKDFYAAIKDGAKTCVYKTFITGVSSVSLDSLTSGFNISLNVTSDTGFNEYAGFTEAELKKMIPQLVDLRKIGATAEEVISMMKPVYDGYCFSTEASGTVYNSSMCLYYLTRMRKLGRLLAPEKCLDPASDHDGSNLRLLFDLAEKDLADEIIDTYLAGNTFRVDALADKINLNKSSKYDRIKLLSMLYYLGYLTIDPDFSDDSAVILKIPNLYISKVFAQCTVDRRLLPNCLFNEQTLDVSSLLAFQDDLSSFASSCTAFLSTIFTNQVLSHMSEMALNLVLHAKLNSLSGVNSVPALMAEMQKSLRVAGEGEMYADLVITVDNGTGNKCIYLIELKYSSKSEASEASLESLKKKAVQQVLLYQSALEFRGKQVKSYAMVFAGSECVHCVRAGS